jgi:hypothetical protein
MTRVLKVVLALSLVAVGCGDDDDDIDATPPNIDSGGNADASNVDSGGATTFNVTLTTTDEAPICASAAAAATGTATITISEDETMITADVTYSGLSGAATAAHIHSGAPGVAGPAIFPFTNLTSPISQTFTAADYPSPPPNEAPADFAAMVAAMKAGQTYINVHTDMCMTGEIRAQIE